MSEPLLSVRDLSLAFRTGGKLRGRPLQALAGVDLDVAEGETFALVGESGSGKTTLGRCVVRLYRPDSGSIHFDGRDITALGGEALRQVRRQVQMVFQDPYLSLNPRKPVRRIIGDMLRAHGERDPGRIAARVRDMLEHVGLSPEHADRTPQAFSGGQRQRIGIARALALQPRLIVADEPVSALDVSIQAQIVNLLVALQAEYRLTYLFIAHDLGLVRQIADHVGILYLGRMVESGGCDGVFARPMHPYTEALLSAVPLPDPRAAQARSRIVLRGDPPNPADPPPGCPFHTRCAYARDLCRQVVPPPVSHADGRKVACHFPLNSGTDAQGRALAAVGAAA